MSTRQSKSPNKSSQVKSRQSTSLKQNRFQEKHSAGSADYLWINVQEEDSQDRDASRQKQAFIRTRHHRLRKELQTQHLKPQPSSTGDHDSSVNYEDTHQGSSQSKEEQSPPLCRSLEQSVALAFPYLARPTDQSMTIYLQHYQAHATKLCFPIGDNQITLRYLRMALDHPALIQILLSTSAFHRATLDHVSGAPSQLIRSSTQDAIRLRSDTIKSIQGILIQPYKFFSEITLRVIAHLLCVEVSLLLRLVGWTSGVCLMAYYPFTLGLLLSFWGCMTETEYLPI
ncbi:hypothetical protein N7539_005503 [Penicillium diatomitis]|uniref:Uncharacterized protein n=1 Tax=Penicillium diatomitis TaxID=2819901 RepID=A0A9W9X8A5_9EURO|nr:uncharacterized protein N7539_005503 [Penicillium diatomitis]KAJ5485515.1 hypothetical protein N7539_005503 [Penicillium diatomitis]